jgi:hypothetical protein
VKSAIHKAEEENKKEEPFYFNWDLLEKDLEIHASDDKCILDFELLE